MSKTTISDDLARGLLTQTLDPLRYSGHSHDRYGGQTNDPYESTGIILNMVPTGSRVLDVGCGTGSVLAWIEDQCKAQVIGLEPHPERAQKARERGLNVLTAGLSDDIVADLGLFDVVVFADVLEHLPNPFSLLEAAHKFLHKTGRIIVSVPNVAHWTVRGQLLRGNFDYKETGIMDATHLRWFTAQTIQQLIEQAGYNIQQQTVSAGTWLPVYYAKRPFRWLSDTRRKKFIVNAAHKWPTLFGCQHIIQATRSLS